MNGMRQSLIFFLYIDYNIMTMSTFSSLTVPEGQKEDIRVENGEVLKSKYPKICVDIYRYRVGLENHNTLNNYGRNKYQIGLEGAWGTT